MNPLVIRPATNADLPALQDLFRQIGEQHASAEPGIFRVPDPPLPRDYFDSMHANPEAAFLVAERDGAVLGALVMSLRRTPDLEVLVPRVTVHIHDLVVDDKSQRQGIGRALMRSAGSWGREHGAHGVELNVWEFNHEARRFYEVLGYRVAARSMTLDLDGWQ